MARSSYRDTIVHALEPVAMPEKTMIAVVDRVEPLLLDALVRGRRLAWGASMRKRRKARSVVGVGE